jgi:hypothetical protein
MRKITVCIAICFLIFSVVSCGKKTPNSTMAKWVKSMEDFNAKMMTVKDKEVVKSAMKTHIGELQEVLAEISEWSAEIPESKKGPIITQELDEHVQKVKDKILITAYLTSRANALRFSFDDASIKIDYDTYVALDEQVRAAFSSVGIMIDKYGEAKIVLGKIAKANEDFNNNLIACKNGESVIAAVETYVAQSQGLWPKLGEVREKLNIADWQSAPSELEPLVKKMKTALQNVMITYALKVEMYKSTPGVEATSKRLTDALK